MAIPLFVDLKRSEWDREKSKPENGEYHFTNVVYYKSKDFKEGYIHPFKLKWCKYSEQDYPRPFASFHKWQNEFKATLLVVGDDYWPETLIPDADGKYILSDIVAVKIPIEVHLEHRKRAVEKSERQARSIKQQFKVDAKRAGVDVEDSVVEKELTKLRREMESEDF